ncbi:unnamed protein product [Amoebophrya sp. A25]|nr:unnamed protein product [Amoebophrya sp. A25]|eukprot:GSA25T00005813001.1
MRIAMMAVLGGVYLRRVHGKRGITKIVFPVSSASGGQPASANRLLLNSGGFLLASRSQEGTEVSPQENGRTSSSSNSYLLVWSSLFPAIRMGDNFAALSVLGYWRLLQILALARLGALGIGAVPGMVSGTPSQWKFTLLTHTRGHYPQSTLYCAPSWLSLRRTSSQ